MSCFCRNKPMICAFCFSGYHSNRKWLYFILLLAICLKNSNEFILRDFINCDFGFRGKVTLNRLFDFTKNINHIILIFKFIGYLFIIMRFSILLKCLMFNVAIGMLFAMAVDAIKISDISIILLSCLSCINR